MRIHFLFVARKDYPSDLHLRHKRQYNLCSNNNEEEMRGTGNVFLLSRKKSLSIAIQDGFCKCLSNHRHNSSFPEIWTMRILKDLNLEPSLNSLGVQGLVMLCLSKDNNSTEQVSCHTVQIIIRVPSPLGYTDHQSQLP